MLALLLAAGAKLVGGLLAWLLVPASVPPRSPATLLPWVHAALLLVFAASGLLLILGGRRDRRARALGSTYLVFASIFADPLLGRAVPTLEGWTLDVARILEKAQPAALLPLLLWVFVRDFPKAESRLSRWLNPRHQIPLSGILGAALFLGSLAVGPEGPFWLFVVLLMVPALVFMISKFGNALPDERRRLSVFVAGLVLGIAPAAIDTVLGSVLPAHAGYSRDPGLARAVGYVSSVFVLGIPLTTAYAVVVDRIFDVRFIVRRAIQYALARYSVLAVTAVPALLLVLYLHRNRSKPLAEVFAHPSAGGLWLMLIALASLLWIRRPLLTAIDRRFFREHYDARRILTELVQACRKARNTRDLASLVAGEVDRALHVDRIAVLVRDPRGAVFRDVTGAVAPLPSAGPLAVLVGGAGVPLGVDLSSPLSALGRLPHVERQWLADAGAQLLVPLLATDDRLVAILLVGDKLSGTRFTQEDRTLLSAVGSAAAIGFEHRLAVESGPDFAGLPDVEERPGVQCVQCGRVHGNETRRCVDCEGATTESLLPCLLRNKFRIERRIGSGGMGVVYRARDLSLNRDVALKTLPRVTPEEAGYLRREARSMASLQHTHLAVIYGIEVWRGLPVLVLEYLAGGTLDARLDRAPLAPPSVVSLGLAMADALHHLHRAGLLHRDIKPSNIGFTADDVPKLLDFGLARVADHESTFDADRTTVPGIGTFRPQRGPTSDTGLTPAHAVAGTAAYLSPEAVAFQPPDPGLDLWSLALTLFEAATGVNPFAAGNVHETIRRITSDAVPDLSTLMPGSPEGLAEFFRRALARQRDRRPATALQFAATLRHLAGKYYRERT